MAVAMVSRQSSKIKRLSSGEKHTKLMIKWLQKKGFLLKAPSCRQCEKKRQLTTPMDVMVIYDKLRWALGLLIVWISIILGNLLLC